MHKEVFNKIMIIYNKVKSNLILMVIVNLLLTSCTGGSGDSGFSALESGGGGVLADCSASSFSPSQSSFRIARKPGTLTQFNVTPSVSTCVVEYRLNGAVVEVPTEGGLISIDSTYFQDGANTVEAIITNQRTSATVKWTVTKNKSPTCMSQTPIDSGLTMSIPGNLSLTANTSDDERDTITFNWKINGGKGSSVFSSLIDGASASQITFTPSTSYIGNNTIEVDIYDGYDHESCSWTVNVLGDCNIASSSPAGSVTRAPNSGNSINTFGISTNTPGCVASWSLNGVPLAGTETNKQIPSSTLNTGSNVLVATLGSGSNTITRSWMVIKNTPPTCAAQSPSTSSTILTGVGVPKTFTTTGSDENGDALSFSWIINGAPAGSAIANSATNNVGTGVFLATTSNVGSNSIGTVISDGYDSSSCIWNVTTTDACFVSSASPSTANAKIANQGGSINFNVVPSDVNCAVTWKINGTNLGTGNFVDLYSNNSNLNAAPSSNSITATLNNGIHSPYTKTWSVVKNSAPTCLSQSPATLTGNTIAIPNSMSFGIIAGDSNGDTMTFNWKVNGLNPAGVIGTPTNSGSASLISFTPSGGNIGTNNLTVDINDGYDTTQCAWQATVTGDCSISGGLPSNASSVRVASASSTLTAFDVYTSSAGCSVVWTLNGAPLSGSSGTQNILSSQLVANSALPTGNILSATVQNGINSSSRTWNIKKNTPPTCTPTPINSATIFAGVGVAKTFSVVTNDFESDSLSISWLYNNANPGSLITSSATGNTGTGVFTGTVSSQTTSTISAVLDDTYDTTRCTWDVQTVDACSVASSLPAVASMRVAAYNGSQTFGAVPNNPACQISWELNSNYLGSGNFIDLFSSNAYLQTGANTLVATLDNGIHTPATHSWVITKNSPPSCSTKNPNTAVLMNYGTTQLFTANIANTDSDTLTYAWTFNGGSAGLFSGIANSTTSGTGITSATFSPQLSQIGTNHNVSVSFTDGYDSDVCSWNVDVRDPSQVHISACLPSDNPTIIYSTGGNSSRTFTVSATGPSLSYQWKLDGSTTGSNQGDFTLTSAVSTGTHALKAIVTDQYGTSQECNWNVKRNAPPVISTYSPTTSATLKMNIAKTLLFSVSATDGNGDSLSYDWTINGSNNAALPNNSSSSNFNPANNAAYLGSNTITVSVNDGSEVATQSWTLEGNYFSDVCNDIYNGTAGPVGTSTMGGKICTLIGNAGVGSGLKPTDNQTLVRIQPNYQIEVDSGNYILSDQLSHTIFYYNTSGTAITRFSKVIGAGKIVAILGNGMAGNNSSGGYYNTDFKLNNPLGLAYDSSIQKLYIADSNNHRVVEMNINGLAQTVFGNGTNTQSAGTNVDGNIGTSHTCGTPTDLLILGKWLYVTCNTTHAIKKMGIDNTNWPSEYQNGYMFAGWLNAATPPVTAAGYSDGSIGATGTTRVYNPSALATDLNGNIYWTESSGTINRVRMINFDITNKTFFPLGSISPTTFTLNATDMATTGALTTSALTTSAKQDTTGLAADGLYMWGPTNILTNTCLHYRVQTRKGAVSVKPLSNTTITLTNPGAGGTFYSDACITSTSTVTISTNQSETDFYYKKTAAGSPTFTATAGALTTTLSVPTVNTSAGGAATKLILYGPNTFQYQTCTKLVLQTQDATKPTSNFGGSSRNILLWNNNNGNFYSDSSCTNIINSVTLAHNGQTETAIYYARTAIAKPNESVTLFGTTTNGFTAGGVGTVSFRQPKGLLVDYDISTGSIRGFFITSNNTAADTHSRLIYVNNLTTTATFGGTILPGTNSTGANHAGDAVVGTTVGGYNGDDQLGNLTKLLSPIGISYNANHDSIVIADNTNYRLRKFNIASPSGQVSAFVGQGRVRGGFTSDSAVPAPQAYLNGPSKAVFDSSTRTMYISDSGNGRIRRVDMLRGTVDTVVGRGTGAANNDPEDAVAVYIQSGRGLTLVTSGSSKLLVYVDNEASAGANKNCLVRAYNPGTSDVNMFGVTIPAGWVKNLAGDFVLGCSAYNGDGAGTSRSLNFPEDIAYDGTYLYIVHYKDHCITKLDQSGNMTTLAGSCNSMGAYDGNTDGLSTSVARMHYPMGIALDLSIAGNLFTVEQNNPANNNEVKGRIRYINTTLTTQAVAANTAPANQTGSTSYAFTITNQTPVGTSNPMFINGMATFGNQICWASGSATNGNLGAHNIYCLPRNGSTPLRIVGPNEQSANWIRGGAPLGTEQEGIDATSAFLGAPYGLTFDNDGNLYIVERLTHTVRMVRRWF